jgi:Protein of unknown function (DUF3228)
VRCGYAEITAENRHLIESCYEARKETELAVLIQYFDKDKVPPPLATHLDIILYSRDQINKENEAVRKRRQVNSMARMQYTSVWHDLELHRVLSDDCYFVLVCDQMGEVPPATEAPWGIISVKGQLCDYELPMQPITMMRNALGKEHGGSGVPLEADKYRESVAFWTKNCAIK